MVTRGAVIKHTLHSFFRSPDSRTWDDLGVPVQDVLLVCPLSQRVLLDNHAFYRELGAAVS